MFWAGVSVRVYSEHASRIELCLFGEAHGESEHRTDEIRQTSAVLATKMARLIELFAMIESRAVEVRQRLFPQLNESLQAQKMQAAYASRQ